MASPTSQPPTHAIGNRTGQPTGVGPLCARDGDSVHLALLTKDRHRRSRNVRCNRSGTRKKPAGFGQAVLLLSLMVFVAATLWLHDFVATRETGTEDRKFDCELGDIRSGIVSRADYAVRCALWGNRLETPARLDDRERIRALLPVGSTYEVAVRGGVTGRVPEPTRRVYLAYVFEVRYRREVESNDGQRIVERRTFLAVRQAKLLTPVDEMTLNLGPPENPQLDQLVFPDPGEGINVGPVRELAEAILGSGVQAVADSPLTQAFLEQDLLSGKSVRLTFVDGEGITSVDPLGWTLPYPQAHYLFTQRVLATELLSAQRSVAPNGSRRPLSLLTEFLNPSHLVAGIGTLVVTPQSPAWTSPRSYAVSLMEAAPAPHRGPSKAYIPLGNFLYEAEAGIITQARLDCPLRITKYSPYVLLYEQPERRSDLKIVYSCRRLERALP